MSNLAEKDNKVVAFPISETTSNHKEVVVAEIENGYTKIAHEIVDTLCRTKLNGQEQRVLFSIIRKTYGYNKSFDWICLSQISEMTGIKKPNVSKSIKSLVSRKIICKKDSKFGINKAVSEWSNKTKIIQTDNDLPLSKQITKVIQIDNAIIQTDNQSYPNRQPQKKENNTKENITKNNVINSNNSQVSKSKKNAKQELDFSSWPSLPTEQVMTDWQALRKQKRAAISQTVINNLGKQFSEAAKHGFSVDDCLSEIVTRGWTGFKCEWLVKNNTSANYGKANQAPDFYAGDISWAEDLGL